MPTKKTISVKVSFDEFEQIQKKAQFTGLTVSEYCRNAALGHEIRDTLPRQQIGKIMCTYRNKIDDAETLEDAQKIVYEMEEKLWPLIK